MPKPAVSLTGISLRRGGVKILRDISWTIQTRQHWALLGANGSGKTTLLKVITGDEWPTSGSVNVLGETFGRCDLRRLKQRIGWVSSSLVQRMPPTLTTMDVVLSGFDASIGLYRECTASEWKRAEQVLKLMGCDGLADRQSGLLSQGEQQRVLIARGLVHRPALLILDEPCAGLDPAARVDFLRDLGKVATRRTSPSMVFVTHHLEEIRPWITHALVLRAGNVIARGPVSSAITPEVMREAFGRKCSVTKDKYLRGLSLHMD